MINQLKKIINGYAGTSQDDRLSSVLPPESFKIDGRKLHDILGATHAFGAFLQYYNEQNESDGDWTCFWKADPMFFLAIVGSIDTDRIQKEYWILHRSYLNLPEDEIDENSDVEHASHLIQLIRKVAEKIEEYNNMLPESLALKKEIQAFIKRDKITDAEQLAGSLHCLIGYHKEVYPQTLPEPVDLNHSLYTSFFSEHWELPNPQSFYRIPFKTGFCDNGFENLHELFNKFLKALKKIKGRGLYWFEKELKNPDVTQPHIALFLTFLRLFDYAREDLNSLTQKHLDYYYKKVLCLKEKSAVPDSVYLVFELANHINEFKLTTQNALLGGKDSNSTPLLYKPIEDWVINAAQVKDLRTTYIHKGSGQFVANPDVTKGYQNQTEKPNQPVTNWRAFGDNLHLPYGEVGFAISSPELILKEGERKIEVTIRSKAGYDKSVPNNLNLSKLFSLSLSSKDGWAQIPYFIPDDGNEGTNFNDANLGFVTSYDIGEDENGNPLGVIDFTIKLPADFPSIEVPETKALDSPWPALKITFLPDEENLYQAHSFIKSFTLGSVRLHVEASGIRENLIVQNDQGVFDGTKKFYPFGTVPELRNNFYLGSEEVFQKKLKRLSINFDWVDPLDDYLTHYETYRQVLGLTTLNLPKAQVELLVNSEFLYDSDIFTLPVRKVTKLGTRSGITVTGVVEAIEDSGEFGGQFVPVSGVTVSTYYYELVINVGYNWGNIYPYFSMGASGITHSGTGIAGIASGLSVHGSAFGGYKPPIFKTVKRTITAVTNDEGRFEIEVRRGNISELSFVPPSGSSYLPISNVKVGTYSTVNVILENPASSNGDNGTVVGGNDSFNLIDDGGDLSSSQAILFKNLTRDARSQNFEKYNPTLNRGFLRFYLTNADFFHKEYAKVLAIKTIEASNDAPGALSTIEGVNGLISKAESANSNNVLINDLRQVLPSDGSGDLPNQPYTPATNGISIDYVSEIEIQVGDNNDGIDQYFHILPFNGYNKQVIQGISDPTIPLLYPYTPYDKQNVNTWLAQGNLYVGLEKLQPGGSLSLLIHVQLGSEQRYDLQAPDIKWSYLSQNNQWLPFTSHQILKDTSYGFTRTGIVQLLIPYEVANSTTLFPGELYWLRAAAIEDESTVPQKSVKALPHIIEVKAQAVEAKFEDNENTLEHLASPLPAQTVTKLQQSRSEVKKIEQPLASINGRPKEEGNKFYRRISERLRHKNRAVTCWDYERILLEQFETVTLVKCIRHATRSSTFAPGNVLLAVIPNIKNRGGKGLEQPRFPEGDLQGMEAFIREKTNLFVAEVEHNAIGNVTKQYLYIENPIYELIQIDCDIAFHEGLDIEYHRKELDNALTDFFSPWLKNINFKLKFSTPIYRSKVIFFLEELPYVDKVLDLKIIQDGTVVNKDSITPKTSRSIFASYINEVEGSDILNHNITSVTIAVTP